MKRKEQKVKQATRERKLVDLQKDAEKRARMFEKRQESGVIDSKAFTKRPLEDSKKTFYKEFKKVVDESDVVIQVLDARDPLGCRCPQLEELIMESGKSKKLVLLLNKIDLVPKDNAEKWLKYLRQEYPAVAFKASTQTQKNKLAQSKVSVKEASEDLLKTSNCVGAGTLLKLLGYYCRNQGVKSTITVGIVGFPNVGKSSVINSLKRGRACNVGATPGVTKSMQCVELDTHVKLLDCPGIVMATGSSDTQIILQNAVKVETLDDPVKPVEAILNRCSKSQVMEKYCVADYSTTMEFLSMLAKRLGKLRKGGIPDILAGAKMVLQDWNSGKISFCTHPPERKSSEHDCAQVMHYLGAEFDLKALEAEKDDLGGLLSAMDSALVLGPEKPTDMEEVQGHEDEEDDEGDEDEDDEEDDMDDSDGHDTPSASVVQMLVKQKATATTGMKEVGDKKVIFSDDPSNQQMNKNKKKAFKMQQKEERKKMMKLVAAEEGAVNVDAKDGPTATAGQTDMADSDDDQTYNFNQLL